MKALISPTEMFTHVQVTSWTFVPSKHGQPSFYQPATTVSIEGCIRVAQVEPDNQTFDVAAPMEWITCPDDCVADVWYYKDGQFYKKPENVGQIEGV